MSARVRTRTGIAAAAGIIAVTTLLARLFGFGRWLVFSHAVGGTCIGEVYATANQLPNVLFEVAAGGALAAVAVPLVAGALARGRPDEADRAASALLTWALTVLVPLAVLLAVLAQPLSRALLGDQGGTGCASSGRLNLAVTMLLVFAPQVPLYGIGIVLAGVLQAHRRFLAAALAPLLSSLVVIVSYALYGHLAVGSHGDPARLSAAAVGTLAGGTTLGVVALSLPLLVPVRRAGIRLRPAWSFPPGLGRRALHLAAAGVTALVAQQLAVLATVWVSNHRGGTGALNVYSYVQAVYLLPYAVLAVPIATAAFPSLVGEDAPQRQVSDRVLTGALRAVIAAGALGAGVLAAVALPAGRFFERLDASRETSAGSTMTALQPALTAYAGGLVGFSVAALLLRALYLRGNPWHGAAAMAAGWLVAAAVPLVGVAPGAGSVRALRTLGLASTAGMTLAGLALAVLVARAWGAHVVRPALRTAVAAVLAALVAAAAGAGPAHAMDPHGLVAAVVAAAVSALVAIVVFLVLLHVGDRRTAQALMGRVLRRRPAPIDEGDA